MPVDPKGIAAAMSAPINVRAATLVFMALVWAVSVAGTEDLLTAATDTPAQNAPHSAPSEARATGGPGPETPPPQRARNIRCWQYGRLIREEVVAEPRQIEGDTYLLQRPNDPQDLQLLDLRSGGLCLIG